MKVARIVGCLFLLLMGLAVIYQPSSALAQEEQGEIEERIELTTNFPTLEITSGEGVEFEVNLRYGGEEDVEFNLSATVPKDWMATITPAYPKDKKIASIVLSPGIPESIIVATMPLPWLILEPGEYKVILEASSERIKGTIELKVEVTARYELVLVPTEGLYNTTVTAGKDNYFSVEVQNLGSAAIDEITFKPYKPEGWTIEFSPEKVDSVAAIDSKTVDVNIKPPPGTVAGDYEITVNASGKQASAAEELRIRVTVETPSILGWVGIGVIVLVIAGLAVIFMRFSRR